MPSRYSNWFTDNGVDATQIYGIDNPAAPQPYTDAGQGVTPTSGLGPAVAQVGAAAPAAANAAAPVGHDGSYNGMTREQYRDAWMSSGAHTLQDLQNFVQQHGGQVVSDNGTVQTPFGEQIDMLIGAKTGNGTAGWGGVGGGGGQATGAPPASGGGGIGGYGGGGVSGSVGQSGHLSSSSFSPFSYENFVAPDPNNFQTDPSYQFRLNQGISALQNSAASKGMLFTGNTWRSLEDYGQQAASQEYQNAYDRAYQTNQANNQGRLGAFTANTNADLGYGNLNLGYTQAANQYDLGLRNNALGYTEAANQYALGQGNLGLGWANYGLNNNAQQFYQNYQFPIGVGLSAAGTLGNYGSNYAQNAGNTYTGIGNAQAAGTLTGASAYNSGLNGLGNAAMGQYYASQYNHPLGSA